MPPRKTASEKHAYHAAEAERHRVAAIVAQDATLRAAILVRDLLTDEAPESHREVNHRLDLLNALAAFIDGRIKA